MLPTVGALPETRQPPPRGIRRNLPKLSQSVAAARLPVLARTPVILSPLSATSRAMKIGLSSKQLSQVELSELALWTVRPRLMAVRGVANVAVWGQRDRQLQVLVDPRRLAANGVTLDQVVRSTGDAASIATGGFLDTPNQRISVRHAAALQTVDDLAQTLLVQRDGVPLRLGDVADVRDGIPPPIGQGIVNDGPGLLLIVEKEPWGNTLDVTRGVEAALDSLAPGLVGVEIDPAIFRPATFIETSLDNLKRALWIGCTLVVLVLFFFLLDWRTALISVTAIPLSLLTALLLLAWQGAAVNTMVLAGLVIALGEVVDDAIIDVENIARRLRIERTAANPRSAFTVVLAASIEVRSAVVVGSLVVALVLLPVFFLEGLAGAFFRPLAASYVLAILASLFVALTVTPALSLLLLPGAPMRSKESPPLRVLKSAYLRVLTPIVRRPIGALITLAVALVATVVAIPRLGEEFLPEFKERDFLMHFVEEPGTGVDAMTRITERASRELRAIPGVRNFGAHIGRAEVADEVVGPNFTELWISIDPDADYDATLARVRETIAGYPGLHRDVLTYLRERIKEVLTGASATLVVRIYGPELDGLRDHAKRVAADLSAIEGLTDLKVEQQVLVPQVQVRLRSGDAARLGLGIADVRRAVTTLVRGTRVGQFLDGQAAFDVVVWGDPRFRQQPEALLELPIDAPGGVQVPLRDVAEVEIVGAPNQIKRENASRRIDVTCNVSGRDLGSVARELEQSVAAASFELGYHAEVLGEATASGAARRRMFGFALLSLIGILLILHADLGSMRESLLVFLGLPFALIGGVVGAFLGGGVLSLGSLIGFVTVFGIAARNSIMLVSHYRHLQLEEGVPFSTELLLRGAEERLSPILMTALTAGLGLLPLVLEGNAPGNEIEHPLAVVILGGLMTSTLLNLFFLPALVRVFGRPAASNTAS